MEQKKPVTVAMRVDEEESSSVSVGAMWLTWPKIKPSTAPLEVENRWIMEARAGPDMATFSTD